MTAAYVEGLPERWDAVLEHRDRALRVARARLSDPHDVDDCVQEGMTRVVAMAELDLGRVGPLLSTVVANVAADTHRTRARSARLRAKMTWSQLDEANHDEPVCDAAEARWLLSQLELLAPRERAVLEHRAAGRSVAETAAELGMSYKAVDSAFTRARNSVKAVWRATLGVIAIGVARTFRRAAPATTAATLAAAVSLAIIGVQAASPVRSGSPAGSVSPRSDNVMSQPGAEVRARASSPRLSSSRVESRARSAPHVVAAVRPAQAGAVRTPPIRETRKHGDESMVQTVQRCLARGITVRPSEVHCNE